MRTYYPMRWILFSLGLLIVFCPVVSADDTPSPANVTVRIDLGGIVPDELSLKPGTTVVWVNSSSSPIRVRFLKRAVSTTCKAPKGFVVDNRGIFVSEDIAHHGVASLCFLERNDYPYEISFLETSQVLRGFVHVE